MLTDLSQNFDMAPEVPEETLLSSVNNNDRSFHLSGDQNGHFFAAGAS